MYLLGLDPTICIHFIDQSSEEDNIEEQMLKGNEIQFTAGLESTFWIFLVYKKFYDLWHKTLILQVLNKIDIHLWKVFLTSSSSKISFFNF